MAIRHVARHFGLDWKTVKDLDRARLERSVSPADLDGIEIIALDVFAIQKGHRNATVIVEPTRRRVLWVVRGRRREDVRPFFELLLGPERCRRLHAAEVNMSAGYELEVRVHCPNAAIVFDLFHVVAKYGREAIDRVRVDRANQLRSDRRGRRVVQGARWLLLKNRDSLRPGEGVQLDELLAANRDLLVVCVLRDALKGHWGYRHAGNAARAWRRWYRNALRSGIEPLTRFTPAATQPVGHPGPQPLAARHQPGRGHQQQDQGHQAHGPRLPRRCFLLPKDPRRVPRSWETNQKKADAEASASGGEGDRTRNRSPPTDSVSCRRARRATRCRGLRVPGPRRLAGRSPGRRS